MIPLASIRLEGDAERVRQSVERAIKEIQARSVLGTVIINDVELPNGLEIEIAHGLGRRPRFIDVSPTRGAAATGRIGELRGTHTNGTPIDGTKVICLQAVGFGATVTVDIKVVP